MPPAGVEYRMVPAWVLALRRNRVDMSSGTDRTPSRPLPMISTSTGPSPM
jgi:hypothetical protein